MSFIKSTNNESHEENKDNEKENKKENEVNAAQCLFQYVETARQQVIVVQDKLVKAQISLLDQRLNYARIEKKLEETTKELDLLKVWKINSIENMKKNEQESVEVPNSMKRAAGQWEAASKRDYEMVEKEKVIVEPAVNLGCSKCRWNVQNGCARCKNVNWKGVRAADRGQK